MSSSSLFAPLVTNVTNFDHRVIKRDHRILSNFLQNTHKEMDDALNLKLKKIKAMSGSIRRRNSMYSDLSKVDDKKTAQSLGSLHRAPAPGKKLQKIGFIMFWVPEPSGVTCAIGGPMILAGKYLDRVYNGSTINDIGTQTKNTVSSIQDFKNSLV